jgi:hypothetical protein
MDWQQGSSLAIVAVTAVLLARSFWKRRGRMPDCEGCSCAAHAGSEREPSAPDPVHPHHA